MNLDCCSHHTSIPKKRRGKPTTTTTWRSGWSGCFAIGRPGFISQVDSYQKTLKNGIHRLPVWRLAYRIVWRTSRQACLLWLWARHLTGCFCLYVADRWWGQAVYPSWWPNLTEDLQTEPERISIVYAYSCIMLRMKKLKRQGKRSGTQLVTKLPPILL